ncbi:MAG: hypothetical protein HYU99_07970, partial [Deltaproteobacteria bacterium]|nr:hypothetical protein [Deltaproteobacteria bacterium]
RRRDFYRSPCHLLILLWFVLSLVPVAMGGRFYGRYFIQILPPLCLLAAQTASRLPDKKSLQRAGIFILIPALFFWLLRVDQKNIYNLFPDDQLFEQQAIGEWLRRNTKPDETLFVWGFATAIYFHAERKPASRFLWTDLLTGKVPGSQKSDDPAFDAQKFAAPEAWEALWEDFKNHPPAYFVDTSPADIHNYKKYPVKHYPPLYRYLRENYRFWKNMNGCLIYKRKMAVALASKIS